MEERLVGTTEVPIRVQHVSWCVGIEAYRRVYHAYSVAFRNEGLGFVACRMPWEAGS